MKKKAKKFQIGDKVKVKLSAKSNFTQNGGFCDLVGKEATVKQIKGDRYLLDYHGIFHDVCGGFLAKDLTLVSNMAPKKPSPRKKKKGFKMYDIVDCKNVAAYTGRATVVSVDKTGRPTCIERHDGGGWNRKTGMSAHLIPKKYKETHKKDSFWDTCGEPIESFTYIKSMPPSFSSSPAFALGDRVFNHGRIIASTNQGKYGTVVDYHPLINEYAIVYDDGSTGAGEPIHYDAASGTSAPFAPIPKASVDQAKKELKANVAVFKIANGPGGILAGAYISAPNTLTATAIAAAFNNLDEETSKKKAKKKAKPLNEKELDKLVLEVGVKKEILSVLKQHDNRDKLFDEWGLGETIEYGRGMTMMFWGGPGTGKTWGAHCIAKALGQELLIVSAAEIQSSEPGASERNIQEAFKTAKEENKVLFFNECDSLITTRADLGMVLAAMVNCLLTEIEKSEGVVILATNRIQTMDEALERRLALIVEFPFPKYAQRIEIWKNILPSKLPLAKELTPEVLAQPKFSGGQIKNIILSAARLAAADNADMVTKDHVDRAVERLNKSKGLMGQVARSRTGRPDGDMLVGVGMSVTQDMDVKTGPSLTMDEFLDAEDEEEDDKDKE